MQTYIRWLEELSLKDIDQVGGKNASLGELSRLGRQGILVPEGFALTAQAYWDFLDAAGLREPLQQGLAKLNTETFANLHQVGSKARELLTEAKLPQALEDEIRVAWHQLQQRKHGPVAARSSATAEDLPEASFAGQQDSFLNLASAEALIKACQACYVSLFTDRAIKYRQEHGFDHLDVALSVGVQSMVRADKGCAGVAFTLDPDSGFDKVLYLTGGWGLGENVVQGAIDPDEFYVFKPRSKRGEPVLISRRLGAKQLTRVYTTKAAKQSHTTHNRATPKRLRARFVLTPDEVLTLARQCLQIEKHYGKPMDIEWAKDGPKGEIYIVQARPETVRSREQGKLLQRYELLEKGQVLVRGKNIGRGIASGKVRRLSSPSQSDKLAPGEILVTETSNPDWDPLFKKAGAVITDRGGRTSHAAIVARESGLVAVVGTGNASQLLRDGQEITVDCSQGNGGLIYAGSLKWKTAELDPSKLALPKKPSPMLILADPDQALALTSLPQRGVGLMRLEFTISELIRAHPMALACPQAVRDASERAQIAELIKGYPDGKTFFIEKLSEAVAMLAAAFDPHDVIVRLSDFKSNEYANLIGGADFEPAEANPMLGFRGAARYIHPRYAEGFALECAAMKRVREDMGFRNVKLMIPFCRTLEQADAVLRHMARLGLKRGGKGLEIYMMCEIPANVMLAEAFAERFDGFSIGSNDLTQLVLGIDRDSELLAPDFDEQNQAVKLMIQQLIKAAHAQGIPVGLCGQAASDHPDFTRFLVEAGIDTISFNPDALPEGLQQIQKAVNKAHKPPKKPSRFPAKLTTGQKKNQGHRQTRHASKKGA